MKETATRIRQIIDSHTNLLMNVPAALMNQKPAPGRWSKKEVIGHLVDSAQNNIRRFIMTQYENTPYITYNQDQWVAINKYQEYETKELVALWAALNRQIVKILESMPPESEEKLCQTEDVHDLRWLAEDYLKHLNHHLHQVLDLEPVAYP